MDGFRSKPQLRPSWSFPAWSGTGEDLAGAVVAIQSRAFPEDSECSITVESKTRGELETENPGDLATLGSSHRVKTITVRIRPPNQRTLESLADRRRIDLSFRRYGNTVSSEGSTEEQAAALLSIAQKVVKPGIPSWSPIPPSMWIPPVLAALIAGLIGLGTASFVGHPWGILTFIVIDVGLLVFMWWGFPHFEVHDGRSRPRRCSWALFLFVAAPAIASVMQIVISKQL